MRPWTGSPFVCLGPSYSQKQCYLVINCTNDNKDQRNWNPNRTFLFQDNARNLSKYRQPVTLPVDVTLPEIWRKKIEEFPCHLIDKSGMTVTLFTRKSPQITIWKETSSVLLFWTSFYVFTDVHRCAILWSSKSTINDIFKDMFSKFGIHDQTRPVFCKCCKMQYFSWDYRKKLPCHFLVISG